MQRLFLEDQRTCKLKVFNLYKDEELFPLVKEEPTFKTVNSGIFEKEKECDYETDRECIMRAKEFLNKDLIEAMEYFVKGDPLILIDNHTF